jgi:hypothetical protein
MDSQTRHMALSSLFMEVLTMMNNAALPTAEFLRGSIRTWIGQKVHGLVVLPLLTAACQSLASVRHMAETTEACITAYFKESKMMSSSALVTLSFPGKSTALSSKDGCLSSLFPMRDLNIVIFFSL